jgi:hypothetical protein
LPGARFRDLDREIRQVVDSPAPQPSADSTAVDDALAPSSPDRRMLKSRA